ncbi:MAG: pirin family protein [Bacteroidota bacterium]
MMLKKLERIIPPPPPHMVGDGFRVHNFFPSSGIQNKQRMSPFFMLDYASPYNFPPSEKQRGVDVHPHRGFETVTIAYQGKVAHHDSAGNHGVIGEGDVQWMTAASGVLHKEYHEKDFSKKGGTFQMVQLWVNLPAQYKMSAPQYQEIKKEMMGRLTFEGGLLEVIAGNYKDIKGPASTFSPLHVFNLHLESQAEFILELPENFNTGLLAIKGSVTIQDQSVPSDHFALFQNAGSTISIKASTSATLLVLSGQPLDEPIVAYGPFLMNSWEEIEQAVEDFNNGKFGVLD